MKFDSQAGDSKYIWGLLDDAGNNSCLLTALPYVRHCVGVEVAWVNIASINRESKIKGISMSGPPRICSNRRE